MRNLKVVDSVSGSIKAKLASIKSQALTQFQQLGDVAVFDEDTVKAFRVDLQKAFREVGKRHGIQVPALNVDATLDRIEVSATASAMSPNGQDCFHNDYLDNAHLYGMETHWLNKSLVYNDIVLTIDGLDTSRKSADGSVIPFLRATRTINGDKQRVKVPINEKMVPKIARALEDFRDAMNLDYRIK